MRGPCGCGGVESGYVLGQRLWFVSLWLGENQYEVEVVGFDGGRPLVRAGGWKLPAPLRLADCVTDVNAVKDANRYGRCYPSRANYLRAEATLARWREFCAEVNRYRPPRDLTAEKIREARRILGLAGDDGTIERGDEAR